VISVAVIVPVILLVGILVFMLLNLRRAKVIPPTQLSHLVCPHCELEFDYAWLPGASFTSIRLGPLRLFNCPRCGELSLFNIWRTKVDPDTHHCETRIGPSQYISHQRMLEHVNIKWMRLA
jgi:hypothetical protein